MLLVSVVVPVYFWLVKVVWLLYEDKSNLLLRLLFMLP